MSSERYRLFLALELPAELRSKLAQVVARVAASRLPPARWVAEGNFHLTLQFLGDRDSGLAGDLDAALLPVFARSPGLRLRLEALGAFPRASRARVLWLGIAAPPALGELQQQVAGAIAALLARSPTGNRESEGKGREDDERPFHPHLTLARCREPWRRRDVEAAAALFEELAGESFEVGHGTLFHSQLGSGGARHHPLASFPLARVSIHEGT